MSRYIVTPILSPRNIPYYVVTDTSTGKGVEGYGCETWAQHRADELNGRKEKPPTEWIDLLDRANRAKSSRKEFRHETQKGLPANHPES